jgi:hypothetical protein
MARPTRGRRRRALSPVAPGGGDVTDTSRGKPKLIKRLDVARKHECKLQGPRQQAVLVDRLSIGERGIGPRDLPPQRPPLLRALVFEVEVSAVQGREEGIRLKRDCGVRISAPERSIPAGKREDRLRIVEIQRMPASSRAGLARVGDPPGVCVDEPLGKRYK